MSTLKAPVFKLDPNSELFKLYVEERSAKEKADEAFKEIEQEFPVLCGGSLGVWSETYMGVAVGSVAEHHLASELVKKEKKGFRAFKKNSSTFKRIVELSNGLFAAISEASSKYRLELCGHFGLNVVAGTHLIDGTLYLHLQRDPERNKEELTEIPYSHYIKAFSKTFEEEK